MEDADSHQAYWYQDRVDELFCIAIGTFLLGSFFLYLSKTAKETKGRELRVGDKQPKNIRKAALAIIAFSFLCLFVALLEHFFERYG
jgi:hypothetical protein